MIKGLNYFFLGLCLLVLLACQSQERDPSEEGLEGDEIALSEAFKANISGQVSLQDAETHSGVMIYAAGTSKLVFTDTVGNFTLEDLKPAEYNFYAWKEGYKLTALGRIRIDAPGTIKLQPVTLERIIGEGVAASRGSIVGLVELEGRKTFDGVVIEIKDTWHRTVSDDLGIYQLVELKPGLYTLVFKKQDYLSDSLDLQVVPGRIISAPTIKLKLRKALEVPRKIYGTVDIFDIQDNPLNNFSEVIIALEGTNHVAVPDGAGRFIFSDIPPGRYAIVASAPGFVARDKIDIDLTSYEYTNVTVVLDESIQGVRGKGTGSIKGIAKFKDTEIEDHSGITVGISGVSLIALTDKEGNYIISDVPSGDYSLIALAEGYIPMRVEPIKVAVNETVEVEEIDLEKKVTLPEVIYTDPADGAKGVAVRREIPVFVRFSKKMHPGTVKAALSIEPEVARTLYMGKEHPLSDFDLLLIMLKGVNEENPASYDTRYNVTIGTEARDFDNLNLEEPFSFAFTTGRARIIRTRPGDGEMRVVVDSLNPIRIFFNATVDHDSLNPRTIEIEPEMFGELTIQPWDSPESGWTEMHIYAKCDFDKSYTVTLKRGIRAIDGSPVENTPYQFKFKTAKLYPLPR